MGKFKKNSFIDVNGEITTNTLNPKEIISNYLYGQKFNKGDIVNYSAKSRKLKKGFPVEEVEYVINEGYYQYHVRGKWVTEKQLVFEPQVL